MGAVASQADIFARAAECERASRQIGDPERRKLLALLCEMWITVANESPFLSPSELSEQLRVVENIQALVLAVPDGRAETTQPAPL